MKIGIMQPYFFPYIGYWQLMNVVDKYVIYDDVNFIKGGWINRNRILVNGQPLFLNLPMQGASSNKKINEILVNNTPQIIDKNLRKIESSYKKAPYYADVFPIIEKILKCNRDNLGDYLHFLIVEMCDYLGIKTELMRSSKIDKNTDLKGQDKVIHICEVLGANEYINAIGGKDLYSYEEFKNHGIKLKFLKIGNIEYNQLREDFQPNLSIIDVMMFNSRNVIFRFMDEYELISE